MWKYLRTEGRETRGQGQLIMRVGKAKFTVGKGEKMELSVLKNRIWEIFSVKNDDLFNAVMTAAQNEQMLSAYCDLVDGDLSTDEMQKIFQYHYADRKEKRQDYTPKSLAKLCAVATKTGGSVVYDLCAGSGALTIQKWTKDPTKTFICEELDEQVIPLLLFNMAVRNMRGWVINRNALTMGTKAVYRLESGERFSKIKKEDNAPDIMADVIISNPPYNIKWDAPDPMFADERFSGKPIPPNSNANFAFVLTALSRITDNGRCAFILPCGCLSSDNEAEIREYLVSAGLVERVIVNPDKMFESTTIPTCVVVFSHGNKTIKFFDCRRKAEKEQRDQNGQFGGASYENRTYHKTVNVLPDELISTVCGDCQNVPGFSAEVETEKVAEQRHVLIPSRYIEFDSKEETHRPYADIMADINRVARERAVIKITCNETLAKQLGLYEVAQAETEKSDDELNKTFELLGGRYEGKRYITLSKNKNEFKVENQDKEILSSLVNFFLPMWKQHIFYLNLEENRLLAELRDAILPELMSGKLEVM